MKKAEREKQLADAEASQASSRPKVIKIKNTFLANRIYLECKSS